VNRNVARVFNFSAGPAALPEEVLKQAAEEMLDWHGTGMSVMEMSHRGQDFIGIAEEAERDLRELLAIPSNYKVLFLQGGGSLQFAMVPLNLLAKGRSADYVVTGEWSRKAATEAQRYGDAKVAASSEAEHYTRVPDFAQWRLNRDAAYVHICTNETIHGVEYQQMPETGAVPLVADMSSHILSRPVDVSRFGLIYAGAQKNIGPAGLVIVIAREDLIGHARPETPSMLDYKIHADAQSMPNTPATYSIYIAGLVFKWIKRQGGIAAMERNAVARSRMLYDFIDGSGFYRNPVRPADRSRMNVPFTLADTRLDAEFLKGAEARGMVQLKGHRTVGGMRASIYNAMPMAGVETLVQYMREFAVKKG